MRVLLALLLPFVGGLVGGVTGVVVAAGWDGRFWRRHVRRAFDELEREELLGRSGRKR